MRKTFFALTAMALLAGACSRKSGGGVKLKADTDSVAYIIGMNVGMNLLKMDSTLNVNAVCEGIRDVFRAGAKLSADDAEVYYLRYMNYVLPEKARAYEEQFLADFAKSNRSYARTPSGVTLRRGGAGRSGADSGFRPGQRCAALHHPHGRPGPTSTPPTSAATRCARRSAA